MIQQLKKIKLSRIRLETGYRHKEKDLSLELDISKQGLKVPLTVEEESENQYVLVDGYRRYYALEFIGLEDAYCCVEEQTSEEERIVKRLGIELHTKRRTAYQLEKMINRLLENETYDVRMIAILCNVKEATITKYIHGSDVIPEWLRRGEQTGAGRHAFTDIHNLNISDETKTYIADRYINREFPKTTIEVIKKATKEKAFKDIPEENVKECIDKIIIQQSRNYETVKEIISEDGLQAGYTKISHSYMHTLTLKLLTRVQKFLRNKHYVKHLSNKQKAELTAKVRDLLMILNPPITWSEFPVEDQLYEKRRDEDTNNLEH
ncbi:ParB/Srx family N-terminal domain-containing protein [Virgibacillus halodenitrificans]|uniref:ParB/Srx family N-terminal domain-containing protein n=1 Tax=Virgibacillus halodenitrificans TaxID=1482 RepID=UPI002DB76894|nr:ParB/Srx family N-terminal domain-containing protein [Virgibacillus halodenitrificans]MEC2159748.1 ParB/Srx family N-terminal domain-containing protein [Virgibacillus halodenitrificans]